MALPLLARTDKLAALDERFRLWYVTDTHLGNRATDETALYNTVRAIAADDHAFWVAGGDKGEYINASDKRFDPADCASWMQVADLGNLAKCQADRYLEITRPIWSQCLFSLDGNHEEQIYRRYYYDVGATIAGAMGVPHFRDGAWLRWTFARDFGKGRSLSHPFDIVALHGWGGGRSVGGKANTLRNALVAYNADLILLGHTHCRQRLAAVAYTATRTDVLTRRRVALFGGSFLDGAGYAIRQGYEPAEIGAVCAEIMPAMRNIEVRL